MHEAGRRYDAMAGRLRSLIGDIEDHIAPVIGMALPKVSQVRLVTRGQWRTVCWAHSARLFQRLRATARLDLEQARVLHQHMCEHRKAFSQQWICVAAQILEAEDGTAQALVIADTIHHVGTSDDTLRLTLAHELTHLAQHQATRGLVLDLAQSPFPYGTPPLAYHQVTEGHAMWAMRAIAEHAGCPTQWGEDTPTPTGKRLLAPHKEAREKTLAYYEAGGAFVQHLIQARGVAGVNALWQRLDLVPNAGHIADPDSYLPILDQAIAAGTETRPATDPESVEVAA
ncbi:zinc-dependent metalloprotease [Streptomyces sp. NPDC048845]|uniref:zinc-dependent metalloprotease n=1 Tax=Streptomyces sp. NPDC048845 TaxID=3155390 RepID=UPI003446087D